MRGGPSAPSFGDLSFEPGRRPGLCATACVESASSRRPVVGALPNPPEYLCCVRGGCTSGGLVGIAIASLVLATSPAGAAPGDLDPNFSRDGSVSTKKVIPEYPTELTTLSDDSLIFVDYVPTGGDNPHDGLPHLLKLSDEGKVVGSFGRDGHWAPSPTLGRYPEVDSLLADGADRIVALISVSRAGSGRTNVLARIGPDGQLDSSFGSGGIVELGGDVGPAALAVDRDGGVAFGTGNELVRLRPDGSPDLSFGATGRVTLPLDGFDRLAGVEIRSTGEVVAAAGRDLFQFNADGSPDVSFGASGRVTGAAGSFNAIGDTALSPDGSIYVQAGSSSTLSGPSGGIFQFGGLVKVKDAGVVDTAFSAAASINKTPFEAGLVVDARGRILETYENSASKPSGSLVARFLPDGTADQSFGFNGTAAAFPGGCSVNLDRLAVDSSDRVLGGGHGCGFHQSTATTVVRLLTSEARRNADADRLSDSADRCPRAPSRQRGGCPALERRISIKKLSGRLISGEIVSFYGQCGSGGKITVYERSAGKDTRVLTGSLKRRYLFSRFGAFHYGWKPQADERLGSGSYYARIASNLGGGPGVCLAAKGKAVTGS